MSLICEECDLSSMREWNDYSKCGTSKIQKSCLCGTDGDYYKFILRRDKRICNNCYYTNEDEYYPTCKVCNLNDQNDGWSVENWAPKQEPKQEKQMKEYKPTSICYLKNISTKIAEINCDKLKSEFFDVINELYMSQGDILGFKEMFYSTLKVSDELYSEITKTEKRRTWLVEHGFIEEVNKLKPCRYCKSTNIVPDKHLFAMVCEQCDARGPSGYTEYEAIKAWNKRR